jgi:prepilin-type N-terminal cleavage/methylation domain-containing protein
MKYFADKNNSQRGVTIAELSIVITVIGLLLAAVTSGIKIKQASELRNFMNDIGTFRVAVEGFKDKYRALPGDMADAYSYWGASCAASSANCNGNDDGNIRWSDSSSLNNEFLRTWQHLTLAGFLEGSYTGAPVSSTNYTAPAINVPATKRENGGYLLITRLSGDTGVATDLVLGTQFMLAGFDAENTYSLDDPILTPSEAASIDTKMDDGLPDTGKVQGRYGHVSGSYETTKCITGTAPNRTYIKTNTGVECVLSFDYRP